MPLQIPIQPVPSQIILCVLGNQNVQIALYLKGTNLYSDINSNGTDMSIGVIALNAVPLDACNSYDGFQGNLFIIDTQGNDDPLYTGLGARWVLIYLTVAEIAALGGAAPTAGEVARLTLNLFDGMGITAPSAGNFTIAHGLGYTPFALELIPTSNGAVWAHSTYADHQNLYLVASDEGVTATALIYSQGVPTATVTPPAQILNVTSPGIEEFAVPHDLGEVPAFIEILPTSFGAIWQAAASDVGNLYLEASDEGVTARVSVYPPVTALTILAPAVVLDVTSPNPGTFSVAHGMLSTPSRIEILMLSGGAIIAQTSSFDATYVYLSASDVGLIGKVLVFP